MMLRGRKKRHVCCHCKTSKISFHYVSILIKSFWPRSNGVEMAFRVYRSMMFAFLPQQLKAPCVALNEDEKNQS